MKRELLDEAYRKLKGSVYMDKTYPYIRYDIAKFEGEQFERKMELILEAINNDNTWHSFELRILESIRAFTFPKEIYNDSIEKSESVVISNVYAKSVLVKKYNNFIDMVVEGHIIGVLWILLVGYRIDENLHKNCFGHRLNESLVLPEKRISESPNLFKPYFIQYETWRNSGLDHAKDIINTDKQSVIISMLDLTRYYYHVNYTNSLYSQITGIDIESKEILKINDLVYKILVKYSELLGFNNKVILPIGFLPSNILANAYLQNFDNKISSIYNTVYYGRYVDDIIVVTRLEKTNAFAKQINKEGISAISSYMLDLFEREGIISIDNDDNISVVEYDDLLVQKSKFRFFYIDKNGYDTIIEKIKGDISKNINEFNYIPDNDVSEINEDVIQFDREDTINKLRSINGITIDKYALSKAIGKNIMMSQFCEINAVNRFISNLNQILNHQEVISNYTQWESIINFLVINKKWKQIESFSAKVVSALNYLDELSNKKGEYEYLKRDGVYSVGDSLVRFYFSCLIRSMSIVWGKDIHEELKKILELFNANPKYSAFLNLYSIIKVDDARRMFCNSRMINRSLLPIYIEECMSAFPPNDESDNVVCFSQLNEYLLSKGRYKYSQPRGKYRPYISSPFDILYTSLIRDLKNDIAPLRPDDSCVKLLCQTYAKNFNSLDVGYLGEYVKIDSNNKEGDFIVSVSTREKKQDKSKIRVAVANVKTYDSDIEDILKDKCKSKTSRCLEISRIINEAIRYKTDILIFPEAYIPIEFLPVIQKKILKHNMALVGGLEHVKKKDSNLVYNITVTLLPLVNDFVKYTIPFFHLKTYYSPTEVSDIIDNNCVPVKGTGHTLFRWKGFSFIPYCCYELTSLELRSKYKKDADLVIGVEWNKDTRYFSNILESLTRDRFCFCAQSNVSNYGDSRIIQPKSSVKMNIAQVKGGVNGTVIIDEIDVEALRIHKLKRPSPKRKGKNQSQDIEEFKPLPAGYND